MSADPRVPPSGAKPAITPAQVAAGLIAGIPIIAKLLAAFGVYSLSVEEQDALTQVVKWGVVFGGLLVGGDAHLRGKRNEAEAAKHAAVAAAVLGNRPAAGPSGQTNVGPVPYGSPAATNVASAGPSGIGSVEVRDTADADGPGDADGVPHLIATDPAEIPADKGDAGPAGLDS